MNYKIQQYSPSQLYENKARLFESLIKEWNNMNNQEKAKYREKVKFTNEIEKVKQNKDESILETLQETAIEKQEQISQQIIIEKSQRQESSENLSAQLIKERQNSNKVRFFEEQKQDFLNSYDIISERETNSQQFPIKSQTSPIQEVIQKEEEKKQNEITDNLDKNQNYENSNLENEEYEKPIIRQRKKPGPKPKDRSLKGIVEQIKPKKNSDQKKALSPSKQIQLEQQKNPKYFFIEQTLTLRQLKDQVKIFLKQNE
ncbi:unnamed protein product [Paramecium sonneborni]|uniref:Uncharacterized protein n=1 Tax=Paramecium sonneborni TaxID=65129 RepID=A0A8S1MPE2_9CILI|nr:unnamed protein product [Paramecium sonneborni]